MKVQAIRQVLRSVRGRVALGWARHRTLWLALTLLVAGVTTIGVFVRLADLPARQAGPEVELAALGGPAVTIQVVYPTRLSVWDGPQPLTVWVRATEPAATAALSLTLDLPDRAAAYVDAEGNALSGRLAVTPGYPEAQPYTVHVIHNDTQDQAGLLRPYRLSVVPVARLGDWSAAVTDAAFEMRLEDRWAHAYRRFALWMSAVGVPYLWLVAVAALAAWGIGRLTRRQRAARERELAGLYVELRQQVRLQQWAAARERIDRLRLLRANYRDVDQLDVMVGAAETATWRREQLYSAGVQAYRERRWPDAVRSLEEIEKETAYYRDVRFLRRTSALYADLTSRDRSQRAAAAFDLGEVADLVDMVPLLEALGDRSDQVSAAAEGAFRRIGRDAFDALLGGLRYDHAAVRQRAYRLIKEMGQAARDDLIGALHQSDVRITAAVADLLMELGARQEVAEALLWIPREHQPGLVAALVGEGAVSAGVLLDLLLRSPAGRQPTLLRAIAALKMRENIDRRIEEMLGAMKDVQQKELLQRALEVAPAPFDAAYSDPTAAPSVADADPPVDGRQGVRRLRLLDRRRS